MAAVAVVEIAPLFLIRYLPLVDLPNHEARIAILAHYGSNPTMKQFYLVDWRPIPDLAFDLFAVPLVRIGLSPLVAGRLFLATAAPALSDRRAPVGQGRSGETVVARCDPATSLLHLDVVLRVLELRLRIRRLSGLVRPLVALASRDVLSAGRLSLRAAGDRVPLPSGGVRFLSVAIIVTVIVDRALGQDDAQCERSLADGVRAGTRPARVQHRERAASSRRHDLGIDSGKVQVLGGMFSRTTTASMLCGLGGLVVIGIAAVVFSRPIAVIDRCSPR